MSLRVMLVACVSLPVAVASAQTPSAANSPDASLPPPSREPLQIRVGPNPDGWFDREGMVTSFWEELPKLVLAGLVGWLVAAAVTNKWDLAKKRNELDLQLAQDFYSAIGKFKAIGRQAEVLGQPSASSTPLEQRRRIAARDRILEQAIELESQIDAVLAKVVLEDRADKDVSETERIRRLHVAGLVRVTIRNLREGIQHDQLETPPYGSPEFYLSNRILSDLGEILYTRALTVSNRKFNPTMHGTDYLNLINYRTADLKIAAAALAPSVLAFNTARARARTQMRRDNVKRVFQATLWDEVQILAGSSVSIKVGANLAVEFADRRVTDNDVTLAATAVFAASTNVQYYLVIADGEARVLLVKRNRPAPPATFTSLQALPSGLPYAANVVRPLLAASLLAWHFDAAAQTALNDIANAAI